MQNETSRQHSELSLGRKLLLIATLGFFVLLVTELGARVVFAVKAGPSVMLYGTPWHRPEPVQVAAHTVMQHQKELAGYTKYFPNEKKRDNKPDSGEEFDVRINSHGFRGAEFSVEKAPKTIRVVTLGASSTFGYHDRDDETYAYYLEQQLNSNNSGFRFEVINLGIPHLKTSQILTLFVAEALLLDPDVVTFYGGINDSAVMEREAVDRMDAQTQEQQLREKIASVSILRTGYRIARDKLLLLALVDSLIKSEVRWIVSEEDYAHHIAGKKETFLGNVSAIHDLCRERGILFIVMKQQAKSSLIVDVAGVKYEDEWRIVKRKLDDGEPIGYTGLAFLTHKLLMDALEIWALENDVPLVDVIELTDERRDLLWTWVHLHPEANQIIAAGLTKTITDMFRTARP